MKRDGMMGWGEAEAAHGPGAQPGENHVRAWPRRRRTGALALAAVAVTLAGCGAGGGKMTRSADAGTAQAAPVAGADTAAAPAGSASLAMTPRGPVAKLPPNELGMIPVLEYHLIQDRITGEFERTPAQFRHDLEQLYADGFRPVTMQDVIDKSIQSLPKGISPVVFTFDDASPSQFSFIGSPAKIDPNSAVGIWRDFQKTHPDWGDRAVFCMLPGAAAGRSFFGNNGIQGQQTAWRFIKVKWLADHGFQLCDHTLWHARLDKYSDAFDMQQIAQGQLAIDSAVPGYKVTAMALPLGMWPKDKAVAWHGSWTNPKTGQSISYDFNTVFEVSGSPNVSPYRPDFDPHHTHRQIMSGDALTNVLKRLDQAGPASRYISDGDPKTIARPAAVAQAGPAGGTKP